MLLLKNALVINGNGEKAIDNIASEDFRAIQAQLRRYGITKITLFPELQSVAGEITQQVIAERIQPLIHDAERKKWSRTA